MPPRPRSEGDRGATPRRLTMTSTASSPTPASAPPRRIRTSPRQPTTPSARSRIRPRTLGLAVAAVWCARRTPARAVLVLLRVGTPTLPPPTDPATRKPSASSRNLHAGSGRHGATPSLTLPHGRRTSASQKIVTTRVPRTAPKRAPRTRPRTPVRVAVAGEWCARRTSSERKRRDLVFSPLTG